MNFVKFLRTPFFIGHLWWLLPFKVIFRKNLKVFTLNNVRDKYKLFQFSGVGVDGDALKE